MQLMPLLLETRLCRLSEFCFRHRLEQRVIVCDLLGYSFAFYPDIHSSYLLDDVLIDHA